ALVRGEPLFRSVLATSPPAFYYVVLPFYWVGHSLGSLRVGILVLGLVGLAATYVAGRLLAGDLAGLVAVLLVATSWHYLHQSAILQADGPAVAISMLALALALGAVRADGRLRDALAVGSGLALAFSAGTKFFGAVTVVPLALVLLGASRGRGRLAVAAIAGSLIGLLIVLWPALASPHAAFDDLVLSHLQSGQVQGGLGGNFRMLLLNRNLPLEALAALGVLMAALRRDRAIVMPLAWAGVCVLAILFYHPLFPHHLVLLAMPLALLVAVGLRNLPPLGIGGGLVAAGLVLATAAAGAFVAFGDIQLALTPDLHDAEMTAAVEAASRPGEYWISDNPYAVAAAGRDIPGLVLDTSSQLPASGLLTVRDLEAARVRYDVRWVLVDSFRLDAVPGFRDWLNQHYHLVERLGGGAVIYTR
ncbi:MAG TPA: glycosyltransferase family 39 protein, partial [Candidatus Angelobacter sp.]|nr:glycosyltransferase family 39 protein [Candidatus Angelobacter sp.]